jgi:hypothetical protein
MPPVVITVRTAKVGSAFIGATTLAGITIRGRRSDDVSDAVRSVLEQLANPNNDDAATAVDLACQGDTIGGVLGELESGDED